MKKRLLYFEILKQINHKNALLITGMRQVGKTTIMRQVFDKLNEKKLWFDLDNPLEQKIFEDVDYNNIQARLQQMAEARESERLYVFIDEIQNFPEITKVIKYLIDHYHAKFVLTGSSNFYLKNLFPESLSGRKFLYELWPLSFQEYLYFHDQKKPADIQAPDIDRATRAIDLVEYKKLDRYYNEYIRFGGFPEVVLTAGKEEKTQILKNIFASFFEKDLQILSDYKDIRELRDLILLLAPRVGSMLDVSRLASELSLNRPRIYEYLEFLQAAFFIRLLPKFSKGVDRAVAGGKKVYFCDNGILGLIGEASASQLFENAVCNQLAGYGDLSFYNKRNTAEIDFILDKKIAIEAKSTGTALDYARLTKLTETLNIKKKTVVSKKYREDEGVISAMSL